jgi:tetratricopeptide (TPR) repeat protein
MGLAGGETKKPKLDVPFCLARLKPIWLPIKAHRFAAYRAKVLQLLPQRVLQNYVDFEKQGQYAACIKLLESATPGSLNVLQPTTLVNNKPLLVETVLQLIVGYSGLCLKNQQGPVAVKLITQVIDSMSLSLRDLHAGHRTVLEAYLYDTALSVCYYMPADVSLTNRAEAFFQQASERYLRLGHVNRYCKCCLRAAAVLHAQGNKAEAEYYTQQALNKLSDAPVSSLLAVCYHNLAVLTMAQHRVADGVAHVRSYVALLRQLPKLGSSWMQLMDNTQWLVLKTSELWPQFQKDSGMRDSQYVSTTA